MRKDYQVGERTIEREMSSFPKDGVSEEVGTIEDTGGMEGHSRGRGRE